MQHAVEVLQDGDSYSEDNNGDDEDPANPVKSKNQVSHMAPGQRSHAWKQAGCWERLSTSMWNFE